MVLSRFSFRLAQRKRKWKLPICLGCCGVLRHSGTSFSGLLGSLGVGVSVHMLSQRAICFCTRTWVKMTEGYRRSCPWSIFVPRLGEEGNNLITTSCLALNRLKRQATVLSEYSTIALRLVTASLHFPTFLLEKYS